MGSNEKRRRVAALQKAEPGSRRLSFSRILEQACELVLAYSIHLVAKMAGQLGAFVLVQHILDFLSAQRRDNEERSLLGALAMETGLYFFEQGQADVPKGALQHLERLQAFTHHLG